MKYWFWRYLHDYREEKKSLLKWNQKLEEAISHRKRIEEDLSDILYNLNDIDENNSVRIEFMLENIDNVLEDIDMYEELVKDSVREILFYYDGITADYYALRYENLDRY